MVLGLLGMDGHRRHPCGALASDLAPIGGPRVREYRAGTRSGPTTPGLNRDGLAGDHAFDGQNKSTSDLLVGDWTVTGERGVVVR